VDWASPLTWERSAFAWPIIEQTSDTIAPSRCRMIDGATIRGGAPQPRNAQKISLPRRHNLSDPISEMLADWIVVFFVLAVGLLLSLLSCFLYSHGDAASDRLVFSRWHTPPVARTAERSDAKCHPAVQSCLILPAEDDSTDAVRALVER